VGFGTQYIFGRSWSGHLEAIFYNCGNLNIHAGGIKTNVDVQLTVGDILTVTADL
jgi:hypothetical protein